MKIITHLLEAVGRLCKIAGFVITILGVAILVPYAAEFINAASTEEAILRLFLGFFAAVTIFSV